MGSCQAPRPLGGEESRGGGHTVPRGAAGKGRGAAKLDARSSRRSAVAAEMLPAPPPLPPPRQPPRGKLTRAVGREESEAVPGTPGGTRRGREGRERRGREGRQTDRLRGNPGRSERGSERGRYRRPPTEAPGAVLGSPAASPGRSSRAVPGWGGAGKVRPRDPPPPAARWDPRASRRQEELCLGGLSGSPRGSARGAHSPVPPFAHPPYGS